MNTDSSELSDPARFPPLLDRVMMLRAAGLLSAKTAYELAVEAMAMPEKGPVLEAVEAYLKEH